MRKSGISAAGGKENRIFISYETTGISPRSARVFLSGRVARAVNGVARKIAHTSANTFGWLFLSFGLLSLFLQLGEYYFRDNPTVPVSSLILGAAFALLSVPLLLSYKPMCQALQDFPLTDLILYEFFCIKRMRVDEKVVPIAPVYGVIVGVILGIVGFIFPLYLVVIALCVMLLLITSFISPEFPFLFTLLVLPYLSMLPYSSAVLAVMSVVSLLSFFRKVMLGKRVYCFENYDIFILLFIAVFTLSGVIGGGAESTAGALVMISLILGYIPAANIVVNRRLANCAVNALIVSAFPVAIGAVVEYAVNLAGNNRIPSRSVMSSPEVLAAFLTASTVLTLFYAITKTQGYKRAPYFFVLATEILALVSTENIFLVPVVLFGAVAYGILRSKKLPTLLMFLSIVLPYLFFLLPKGVLSFVSDSFGILPSLEDRLLRFSESLDVFADNIFLGVGLTDDAANTISSINLPLGLVLRFGIFSLVIFVVVILHRLYHLSVYSGYYRVSAVYEVTEMTALASVCLMIFGAFCDVFADMSIFYLFWCVMGLCSANLRVAKNEHDDRVGYYSDLSSFDASDTSVSLSREV